MFSNRLRTAAGVLFQDWNDAHLCLARTQLKRNSPRNRAASKEALPPCHSSTVTLHSVTRSLCHSFTLTRSLSLVYLPPFHSFPDHFCSIIYYRIPFFKNFERSSRTDVAVDVTTNN